MRVDKQVKAGVRYDESGASTRTRALVNKERSSNAHTNALLSFVFFARAMSNCDAGGQ